VKALGMWILFGILAVFLIPFIGFCMLVLVWFGTESQPKEVSVVIPDECEHMLYNTPGSCARCEGT